MATLRIPPSNPRSPRTYSGWGNSRRSVAGRSSSMLVGVDSLFGRLYGGLGWTAHWKETTTDRMFTEDEYALITRALPDRW
jgi:hypothetical protein